MVIFESELLKGQPKEFLLREWARAEKGNLALFKSLPVFLKEYFPDIKLSDEIDKSIAIEKIENSFSFMATHSAISSLQKYDDFNEIDLYRILEAFISNQHIHWILEDEDIRIFAAKLVTLLKTEKLKDAAKPLVEMLDQLETQKPEEDKIIF